MMQESIKNSSIDFQKRLLHITHTKSKRVRIIPLNETAFQLLQEIGPKLFSHLDEDKVSRTFAEYVKRA